ncbi:MAG: hypothetical protein H6696_12465 [Deferribacteres bacterium]|nr:hypothetical protein [candidate division KSB1 bacterium]MCB9502740.1 hypothetical protein [Deferribacteres bacterium]
MSKKIKLIYKILIILIVVISLLFLFVYFFLFQAHKNENPILYNFNPTKFSISTTKPIFFSEETNLFYSRTGNLTNKYNPIWSGEIRNAYVSPNSEYIIINTGLDIQIVDYSGNLLQKFSNKDFSIFNRKTGSNNRQSGKFWGGEFQWDHNSNSFIFIKDDLYQEPPDTNDLTKNSIYRYELQSGKIQPIFNCNERISFNFYTSNSPSSIYYEYATEEGNLGLKKVSSNNSTIEKFLPKHRKISISPDSIFINYKIEQFQGYSYDTKSLIVTINDRIIQGGYYLTSKDTTKLLISGKYGYSAFKGFSYSFEKEGYFLPGNQFYLSNVRSSQYNGSLVFNIETGEYMKLNKEICCYFSVTNNDYSQFEFRYELVPLLPEFATSAVLRIEGLK